LTGVAAVGQVLNLQFRQLSAFKPSIDANVSALQKYQTVFIRSSVANQPASELFDGTEIVIEAGDFSQATRWNAG